MWISRAQKARITWEADWYRQQPRGGAYPPLAGPFGDLLLREIEKRWGPGPRPILGEGDNPSQGYGQKWALLATSIDLIFHPMHRAADQKGLLYKKPYQTIGDLGSNPFWRWLQQRSEINTVFQERQRIVIGIGSACIIPVMDEWHNGQYYPAGIDVLYPDQIMVEERGGQVVYAQRISDGMFWDMTNPAVPAWGIDGKWSMTGEAYPWRWRDEPLMPVIPYRDHWARKPLDVDSNRVQGTLDIIMMRTYTEMLKNVFGYPRALLISDSEVEGLEEAMFNPGVLNSVYGLGASQGKIEVVNDATQAIERLDGIVANRIDEVMSHFDMGLKVRRSEAAKSGVAIKLELTGLYTLRDQLVSAAKPRDIAVQRMLIATHNYLVKAGHLSLRQDETGQVLWTPGLPSIPGLGLIPEIDFDLAYPFQWTSDEREQLRKEMEKAVDRGSEYPQALWLLDHDLVDDRPAGPNWQRADAEIQGALAASTKYAALGYGLSWEQRSARTQTTKQ